MTLALVCVPRISEAADHQSWLKLSIEVPLFAPWDDGRIVFGAEQEEKFGKRSGNAFWTRLDGWNALRLVI